MPSDGILEQSMWARNPLVVVPARLPSCSLAVAFLGYIIPEPVFLNVYEAQESIPGNEFRQPM